MASLRGGGQTRTASAGMDRMLRLITTGRSLCESNKALPLFLSISSLLESFYFDHYLGNLAVLGGCSDTSMLGRYFTRQSVVAPIVGWVPFSDAVLRTVFIVPAGTTSE